MSRIRGPYVRFCERDEANLIRLPHPTRFVPTVCGTNQVPRLCIVIDSVMLSLPMATRPYPQEPFCYD